MIGRRYFFGTSDLVCQGQRIGRRLTKGGKCTLFGWVLLNSCIRMVLRVYITCIPMINRSYTMRPTQVGTSNYYNCLLHRNCSAQRFFVCVWLAFVLMLTIFHHPKTKIFCLASFLVRKKHLLPLKRFFFFARKLAKQNVFALIWWKIVSTQHAVKNSIHTSNFRPHVHVPEEPDSIPKRLQAGCHPEGAESHQVIARGLYTYWDLFRAKIVYENNELVQSKYACGHILCGAHYRSCSLWPNTMNTDMQKTMQRGMRGDASLALSLYKGSKLVSKIPQQIFV